MENIIKEFPNKNARLKYSFIIALILEIMFLLLFAEISIIAGHFIKPAKKVKPLLISVVSLPHKKKVLVPPKKRVVPVKKIKKVVYKKPIIKKVIKKVLVKKSIKPAPFKVRHVSIPMPAPAVPVVPVVQHAVAYHHAHKKIPASILDKYFGEIKAKVVRNLVYPYYARKEGMEGYVNVLFKILRNGDLVFEKIEKGSRYGTLNASAIKTIKISAPFMPFPKGISRNSLTFLIKIHFKLKRR
ncbi:MAG: energy transducer TonB [Deltaproteobacteria bacterium]|jgi:TonB family protein|nr:energy transducer TonB [Deltaproteobacteria bacterium]MCL5880223.1 energy transducer TonB [Deltaproteobacteria bacterium]